MGNQCTTKSWHISLQFLLPQRIWSFLFYSTARKKVKEASRIFFTIPFKSYNKCRQIQGSLPRSNWSKMQEQLTWGVIFRQHLLGKKFTPFERLHELVTTKNQQLTLCLANYLHTQANAGAGVQPVAGATSDVFCAELYFFVTNLTCFICQLMVIS